MPVKIKSGTYYRSTEACRMAGISKNTFLRWIREGNYTDVAHRDWRGWRLFTEDDVARLKLKVNHINKTGNSEDEL